MRLLVLGGTVFLSKEVAAQALARGHDVTCAARAVSGEPPPGVRFVRVDRDEPDGLAPLAGEDPYDVVVDVSWQPSQVRAAVAALDGRVGHWVYVSSLSAYADLSARRGSVATTPLLPPAAADVDESDLENYGTCKVACEDAVRAATGDRALVVRAGLIVGPGDSSDRFPYWPVRLERGGEVLVPGVPDDPVQVIDVRDLARWIVDSAERGTGGILDVTGPTMPRAEFMAQVAAGVGAQPPVTWVASDFLLEQGVNAWSGERSLPLWLPQPEYGGIMDRDVSAVFATGLATRPLSETARDTLAWRQAETRPPASGITADDEIALLAAWRERDGR